MDILQIALKFELNGEILTIQENNIGLINKTFMVKTTSNKYIIQKINNKVFSNPKNVMNNIKCVIDHLNSKYKSCENLNLIYTKTGNFYLEENNEIYRCYNYLSDSIFYNKVKKPIMLYEMGKTIGQFHSKLIDLNPKCLEETIKNFHDTDFRYQNLVESYKNADCYKQQEVFKLYQYVNDQIKYTVNINKMVLNNEVPLRVVHNDTKINNIVFNKYTNKGKCLIDLDTVMPGTLLFDYGDALRSIGSNLSEESIEFDKIEFSVNNLIYFTIGYLNSVNDMLEEVEYNHLFDSIYMITFECGMRFLTDYLENDKYFTVKHSKHNLNRAINQLTLAKNIKEKELIIKKILYNLEKRIRFID